MIGRIIGCMSCVLCGLPFLYIGTYEKNNKEPISFWTGDTSLSSKLKDIQSYNLKMAKLYKNYSIAYFISAITFIFSPIIGMIILCISILGIFVIYKYYKKYLNLYS